MEAEEDIGFFAERLEEADFGVGVEAGQNAGGVVVEEKFSAEFQVEFRKSAEPVENGGSLFRQVSFTIKAERETHRNSDITEEGVGQARGRNWRMGLSTLLWRGKVAIGAELKEAEEAGLMEVEVVVDGGPGEVMGMVAAALIEISAPIRLAGGADGADDLLEQDVGNSGLKSPDDGFVDGGDKGSFPGGAYLHERGELGCGHLELAKAAVF